MKLRIAKLFQLTGINAIIYALTSLVYGKKYIRVVNYHGTPPNEADNFEAQLKLYQQRYTDVSKADFDGFFNTKSWTKSKPGLIISFDDALLTNYEVAVPLLEKYGFTGWMCVPSGFVNTPVNEQAEFMANNSITDFKGNNNPQKAMSWDQLKEISGKHVIVNHTYTHHRMNESDTAADLEKEVVESNRLLEEKLGMKVDTFCWVGGELHAYTHAAYQLIKKHYKFGFMTNNYPVSGKTLAHEIQRTNIESHHPMFLVKFYMSGIYDLFYRSKRKAVAAKTRG